MWILIIFIYAGAFSNNDSVALTSVHGFQSESACKIAGTNVKNLETLMKESKFICVKVD